MYSSRGPINNVKAKISISFSLKVKKKDERYGDFYGPSHLDDFSKILLFFLLLFISGTRVIEKGKVREGYKSRNIISEAEIYSDSLKDSRYQ